MLNSPKLYGKSHKVIFIGQPCVGKSSIIRRMCRNEFNPNSESTIGAAYTKVWIPITKYDTSIPMDIWDTAGQERFNSLIPMYLKGTEAVFAVFDATCLHSYEMLKLRWLPLIMNTCHKFPLVYCCANKTDLLRNDKERDQIDEQLNEFISIVPEGMCKTFKTSAKFNSGINEAFNAVAMDLYNTYGDQSSSDSDSDSEDIIELDSGYNLYSGCCS